MDGFPSQSVQREAAAEDQVVYVDELAGADDYWLSITDASRVCRVQDVSIRRAIARKVLPVRRQRAGQNKRTRFVRASDLAAAGFPIIDESAAITGEIGKLDVLSIPRQQQQIVQEHQELMTELAALREALAHYQERVAVDLRQQQEQLRASLHTAREDYQQRLAAAESHLTQENAKLQRSLSETFLHLSGEQQSLAQKLAQAEAEALARADHLQAALETLSQQFAGEQAAAQTREQAQRQAIQALQDELAQAQKRALAQQERLNGLDAAQRAYQEENQRRLAEQAATWQKALEAYVSGEIQRVEQATQARFREIEQQFLGRTDALARSFEERATTLTRALAQLQHTHENLSQQVQTLHQELEQAREQQQTHMAQYAPLLPLMSYARQSLATAEDLHDLETRLLARQRELERYQPLLSLLSPERLAKLARLLEQEQNP